MLYPVLVERLKTCPSAEALMSFLGARCEETVLAQMSKVRPDILEAHIGFRGDSRIFGIRALILKGNFSLDRVESGHHPGTR